MKYDVLCSVVLAVGLMASPSLVEAQSYKVEPAFPNLVLERPVSLVVAPDGSGRQFLVQQRGKILILPKDEAGSEAKVFLDFTDRKMEAKDGLFEEGLLGLAFHPKFKENGKFYVYYSQQDLKRSVISELQVSKEDADKVDASSERILMEIPQPFWNHNSGNLTFGPDGYLYIGSGDGGKRDDITRAAQNAFSLLGKVLRIDVNGKQGSRQYAIPKDNPYAGQVGAREEVFALGIRNPWGMSFDEAGNLWVADVGQDIWEEINIVEKGGNYGWSFREGARPFALRTDAPPQGAQFIDPIHEYSHAEGISITGGFVYRGKKLSKLVGSYVYGDWGSGRIWALKYDVAAKKKVGNEKLFESELDAKGKGRVQPTAFCEDVNGELLILDWNGKLFRLVE
ncbi:PQQ-dependent sugar dehydrogenase [Phragmitibacter flavus]|uniref:PQQ-dependent sugar dehydrogenase n=1 Tax=Phragmitibacter flavus TaxID=2576071 RepID=A0A5R8KFI5_9BACT|nr:PQQ-dependent sugar dehydrogenase [Phragmitibacter flavus]TLD70359.1 PQQ-dependent sugar dehydrogenase [Phragmitibacter flavus]